LIRILFDPTLWIFFWPKRKKTEKFVIFRGKFPNPNPNQIWPTQPGTIKNWPQHGSKIIDQGASLFETLPCNTVSPQPLCHSNTTQNFPKLFLFITTHTFYIILVKLYKNQILVCRSSAWTCHEDGRVAHKSTWTRHARGPLFHKKVFAFEEENWDFIFLWCPHPGNKPLPLFMTGIQSTQEIWW